MNKKLKIAIIGSSGLLGSNLVELYKKYDLKLFSRTIDIKIDFFNLEKELNKNFISWIPDIIINTIALVNLQKCEEDMSLCEFVNISIAKELALVAKKYSSYYIHISTDHFFVDNQTNHNEDAKVCLLNNYAKTKYKAEMEVLKSYKNSLVVRTNIIGFRKSTNPSFFEWLLHSLINQKKINLYTDVFTSPISVRLLGKVLLKCYYHKLKGLYNISSNDVISKYDFGVKVCRIFDLDFKKVNKELIYSSQDKNGLLRARNNGLDVSKIEKTLNEKMPTVEECIKQLYLEYKEISK